MKVLRASDYQRMPWKNGGGETSEIAVAPPGASLDTLEWRISMAVVAQDGPFSMFTGIDRTLAILDGRGMELDFGADGGTRTVTRDTAPFHFPADLLVHARLLAGTVTDLNVMTRRDRYSHTVDCLVIDQELALEIRSDRSLLFCEQGTLTCTVEGQAEIQLGARDCLLLSAAPGVLKLSTPPSAATVYLIQLRPAADSAG